MSDQSVHVTMPVSQVVHVGAPTPPAVVVSTGQPGAAGADGRDVEPGIAERHRIDRQLVLADRDAADDARVEPAGAVVDQPFELGQFGDGVHHAAPLQRILNIARLG